MHVTAIPVSALLANPRVLIVEESKEVGEALVRALEQARMPVTWTSDGASAVTVKRSFKPDIVLMDIALADVSGVELVALFAREGDCGIIVVSENAGEADRVVGLELGADDYVAKPAMPRELIARIRAVYRRMHRAAAPAPAVPRTVFQIGPIRLDTAQRSVRDHAGRPVRLTAAEFAALEALAQAVGRAVSRATLSEMALRRPYRSEDRGVDQLISNLRAKLPEGDDGPLIHSIRGAGYVLRPTQATGHIRVA